MKVKKIINTLNKIIKILEIYESQNLTTMLDDIFNKVNSENNKPKKEQLINKKRQINIDTIPDILSNMEKEDMKTFLTDFKKLELIEIGKRINIKLLSKDKKETIIESIINHFDFIKLNSDMAKRKGFISETESTQTKKA